MNKAGRLTSAPKTEPAVGPAAVRLQLIAAANRITLPLSFLAERFFEGRALLGSCVNAITLPTNSKRVSLILSGTKRGELEQSEGSKRFAKSGRLAKNKAKAEDLEGEWTNAAKPLNTGCSPTI